MRLALVLVLACSAPSAPRSTEPRGDGGCAEVAWSCAGVAPGATEAWGCTEGDATQRAHQEAVCTTEQGGRFALNPCLRDLAVSGCTVARGSTCTTTWFHAPATRGDVERSCARQGGSVVAP